MTFPRFCCMSLCLAAVAAVPINAAEFKAVTVFQSGEGGYKVYRIPAVIRAQNGDILAFCEARAGGDQSEIDLVLKRSTDNGASWQALQVVQESDDYRDLLSDPDAQITVGNPAPVVDVLHPGHPGRIWLPFTLENDRVFVTLSDDHGRTWSQRREITKDVKRKSWGWYATGPVHSIQLMRGEHRGRLVVPCDHRIGDDGEDRGENGAHAILSDDHGETWRLGAIDDTYDDGLNANETTVVELNDGTVFFNTRDQHGKAPGTRGDAISRDGGQTFVRGDGDYQTFQPSPDPLDPPVVQSALLRASSILDGDRQDLILFSGPDVTGPNGNGRSDLRIRYTTNETKTWKDGPMIHVGKAAYSDMVKLASGEFGILFEAGEGKQQYDRICFTRFTIADLGLANATRRDVKGNVASRRNVLEPCLSQ